jgi:restriction system protein
MSSISFKPQSLADALSETVGYKSGLALSVDEMCDHLHETGFSEILRVSEKQVVSLRSEEYEQLFYDLLNQIGYISDEYYGDMTGMEMFLKYKDSALEEWLGVTDLFAEIMPKLIEETRKIGQKSIDPSPLLQVCFDKYGSVGLDIVVKRLEALNRGLYLHPHSGLRYIEWTTEVALKSLFSGTSDKPEVGHFIDQRFIDYLSANQASLPNLHWRKFEELTGEFFHREGYQVELGPGSNDDGVDVRLWRPGLVVQKSIVLRN